MTSAPPRSGAPGVGSRGVAATLHWWRVVPLLVLVAVLALAVEWWVGLLVLVVGVAVVALMPRGIEDRILALLGAELVDDTTQPGVANLVDGLSLSHGVTEPLLAVVDDPGANAAVVAGPSHATLVLTTGLLDALDRVELEAVVAQLLARVRSGHAFLCTRASWFVCGRGLVRRTPAEGAAGLAALGVGLRGKRLRSLLGAQVDMRSDLDGVALTRYPPGLRDALVDLAGRGTAVASATWGSSPLWLASPFPTPQPGHDGADEEIRTAFDLHDPIQHRIDLLGEL